MGSLSVLQVEDDGFFQEIIAGIFEDRDRNIKLTQISSLSEVSPAVQKEQFDIAIIDGKFLDMPNWEVNFYLPEAFDIIKKTWIQAIYVFSGEKLSYIQTELWPNRIPDDIFDKPRARQLVNAILNRFKGVILPTVEMNEYII